MTDIPDRLTIVELEHTLLTSRLDTIDARLALLREELRQARETAHRELQDGLAGLLAGITQHLERIERRLPPERNP